VKTPTTAEIQKYSGWFGAALQVGVTAKKMMRKSACTHSLSWPSKRLLRVVGENTNNGA